MDIWRVLDMRRQDLGTMKISWLVDCDLSQLSPPFQASM